MRSRTNALGCASQRAYRRPQQEAGRLQQVSCDRSVPQAPRDKAKPHGVNLMGKW